MANRLKVAKVSSILELHRQGWSSRRIARELGISRGAVGRHLAAASNEAKAPTGSSEPNGAKAPAGSGDPSATSNRAKAPTGSRSLCEPFREIIVSKLEAGLSAQRIFQDLTFEHGFEGKYSSVRRYAARLSERRELPFRRLESLPGEEAQVDFGTGAPIVGSDGRKRRTHVLRVVLSHSRKGYSEVVYRQTTEDLIRCLENAFIHFGGAPKTVVTDNLKAAVKQPDRYDPDLNPKLQSFCEHYGTVLLPTRPRMPRHKGKVERGVDYVQENALKGRTFTTLETQNQYLLHWESNVADTRIHGTIKKQVLKVFEEAEREALLSLPADRFPCFREERRKVAIDGHVAVDKAYYSMPPEYAGLPVWVRWDGRFVRIYDQQMKLVCTHAATPAGRFSTHRAHLASEKIHAVEQGVNALLDRTELIGPKTYAWALGCVSHRGIQATRVLHGLLRMTTKYRSRQIEAACDTAHANGCYRLKSLRTLVEHQASKQQEFPFLEQHPLIRNLSEYGSVVRVDLQKEASKL